MRPTTTLSRLVVTVTVKLIRWQAGPLRLMRSQILTVPQQQRWPFLFSLKVGCLLKRAEKTEEQIARPPGGKGRWTKPVERADKRRKAENSVPLSTSSPALPSAVLLVGILKRQSGSRRA